MKKLDYIIIIFVFILSLGTYGFYFYNKGLDSHQLKVEVRYKNEVLESFDFENGLNKDIDIECIDGKLTWKVSENGVLISEKSKEISSTKHTYNFVHLSYKDIHMIDANCHGGQCLRMKIVGSFSPPIYCTNGITVSLTGTEIQIII